MIGRIRGILIEKHPPRVLVDCHGVGYEIDAPMSTIWALPELNQEVILHTQLVVREDAQNLYGFATLAERELFQSLLKVSGIGARMALAVLSGMQADEFIACVQRNDATRLTTLPGIGKKTAERLMLELKGKLGPELPAAAGAPAPAEHAADVLRALLSLGYSEREATLAARQVPPEAGVSEGIKHALKLLAKG